MRQARRPFRLITLILIAAGTVGLSLYGFKLERESRDIAPLPTSSPTPTIAPSVKEPYREVNSVSKLTDPRLKEWLSQIPEKLTRTEYLAVVVVPEQKNYLFKDRELIRSYTISTGAGQNRMPEGFWKIENKLEGPGGIYGSKLMFLSIWNGKKFEQTTRAFHGTNEPEKIGTKFGLGCVYHHNKDIDELYELIPSGTQVITTYQTNFPEWDILIGGTVVLSRGVDERIRKYNNTNFPWEKISPLTTVSDLNIANLKSPFVKECPYVPDQTVFCAQDHYVKGLQYAHIDMVSISGNHIGDYNTQGIQHTIEILDRYGILHTGAGSNYQEAWKPQIIELKGPQGRTLRIGFFSFNTVPGTSSAATTERPGITLWDEKKIKSLVTKLAPQVDLLISMPNWGQEYTHRPTPMQIEMGHHLIDWGVDVVAGDQAHWVQKYEEYQQGVIFYGLGNFVFDQMWSQKTREGILVKLTVDESAEFTYQLIPIIIEDYAQPRPADTEESQRILDYIK